MPISPEQKRMLDQFARGVLRRRVREVRAAMENAQNMLVFYQAQIAPLLAELAPGDLAETPAPTDAREPLTVDQMNAIVGALVAIDRNMPVGVKATLDGALDGPLIVRE